MKGVNIMSENESNEILQKETPKEEPKKVEVKGTIEDKWWNVLSYCGILWLVTMLACPNKDKKEVKFHIGQGMLISILIAVVYIVNRVLIANIFTTQIWFGYRTTSGLGYSIMWILNLVPVAFAIIGIINAYKEEKNELPIIGKFAFYK